MKVTLVADSCFIFEHRNIRILTDPWIGTTIAGGSWVQFPQPTIKVEEIGRLDYIFISHIHDDHCDLKTLRKLDANAVIVIMDRRPNYVENFIKFHNLKFKDILTIKIREKYEIMPGFELEVVEADPEHKLNYLIDSSLLIHYDDKSIYFANDNPPYSDLDEYMSRYDFELAIIPPVGGSGYPAFYDNLSHHQKLEMASSIRLKYFDEMLKCLRRINPRLFAVAANGHVLSGKNAVCNKYMCWPDNNNAPFKHILENLSEEDRFLPLIIKPGDTLELVNEKGWAHEEAIKSYNNKTERDNFIENVASKVKYFYEDFDLRPSINFEKLFIVAHETLKHYLTNNRIDINVTYILPYPVGDIQKYAAIQLFNDYNLEFLESNNYFKDILEVKVEPRVLYFLLTGGFSWNIADATGFISYDRKPDLYIYDSYIALNFLRI
jgi:UDP-MurNAc hydroxylase